MKGQIQILVGVKISKLFVDYIGLISVVIVSWIMLLFVDNYS